MDECTHHSRFIVYYPEVGKPVCAVCENERLLNEIERLAKESIQKDFEIGQLRITLQDYKRALDREL